MSNKSIKESQATEALQRLRSWLKPGDTVYTILRHVSSSGMSRDISAVFIDSSAKEEHRIYDLDYNVQMALGWPSAKRNGIRVGGCGMDMGFHMVYSLASRMYPEGFGIVGEKGGKKKRPKTEAEAARMVKEGWKFYGRNGDKSGWDNSGGYALNQKWL